MKVYLKPVSGTPQDSLERAKIEMERVVGFRGTVTGAEVQGNKIAVEVEISPKWDLPEAEKAASLEMWIRSKTRTVFRVTAMN